MNVTFRLARADDAAAILSIYAPFCETSHVSFETVAPTEQQMRERICRILPQYPWLIAEVDGVMSGYVYASQHRERAAYRWGVDVAVYIAERRRRRGLGGSLYNKLFAILRGQGYFKAFAGITLPNPASVGLHEALGFRPAGLFKGEGYKLGHWLDVGWWQLDLQLESTNPPEPQSFREFCDGDAVASILGQA